AAGGLPGCPARRADLYREQRSAARDRGRSPAGQRGRRDQGVINSERALILAPGGRDGAVAATLLRDAGRESQICASLAELLFCLNEGAGLAIITAEALQYADLTLIRGWIEQQPAWSDFPFLILNHRGDKPEQAGLVHQLRDTLGNV